MLEKLEIFCWRNNMKFCTGGEKASGNQGENVRQWKKVNKNTYDISSIKRVTKKFERTLNIIESFAFSPG